MSDQIQYSVDDLLRLMQTLRDPERGCPWDQQQTFATIVPFTIEECYELAQAIADGDMEHIAQELGDVLFQVVFYAQLGSEKNAFDFHAVVHALVEKMLRRHPHVFANGRLDEPAEGQTDVGAVKQSWEAIKQAERDQRKLGGTLDDVPLALPALSRAQKLQKRAAGKGFDWSDLSGVFAKLEEEVGELRVALAASDEHAVAEEMGDLLFTCVNIARHLKVDAETVLRGSNNKFQQRFTQMEILAEQQGLSVADCTDAQLDALWERVKSDAANNSRSR